MISIEKKHIESKIYIYKLHVCGGLIKYIKSGIDPSLLPEIYIQIYKTPFVHKNKCINKKKVEK